MAAESGSVSSGIVVGWEAKATFVSIAPGVVVVVVVAAAAAAVIIAAWRERARRILLGAVLSSGIDVDDDVLIAPPASPHFAGEARSFVS